MKKRIRKQFGSVVLDKRSKTWHFIWWENGKRRSKRIGSRREFRTKASAWKAAHPFVNAIECQVINETEPITVSSLVNFYRAEKMPRRYSTRRGYEVWLKNHILPRWGELPVTDMQARPVELWLQTLLLAPKSKAHIRGLLSVLWDYAMWRSNIPMQRNPMELVEVKGISKRRRRPCVLQVQDAWRILDKLVQPYRTMVLIALCFGLRISEILGLRWTDFDFKRSIVLIQRSAVGKRLNRLKTEYSQDEVPLEKSFIAVLKKWQEICAKTEQQWVFPSPATGRPYHADSIRADYLVPVGLKLGVGRIGFHTFRHTYRAWLDETGAPMGVQQKLMRHAHISTTMDQYGNASAIAKRKANRPIVQRVLRREMNQQVSIQ